MKKVLCNLNLNHHLRFRIFEVFYVLMQYAMWCYPLIQRIQKEPGTFNTFKENKRAYFWHVMIDNI